MNIKDDDRVSAVALVVESEESGAAVEAEDDGQAEFVEASSDGAPESDGAAE
jgi:hypothetical protein